MYLDRDDYFRLLWLSSLIALLVALGLWTRTVDRPAGIHFGRGMRVWADQKAIPDLWPYVGYCAGGSLLLALSAQALKKYNERPRTNEPISGQSTSSERAAGPRLDKPGT